LAERPADGVKRRANRLFQGFFEGLIGGLNRRGGILEAMQLAGLMGHTRPDLRHRQEHRFLIITDHTANAIAKPLNWLKHPLCQGQLIGRKERDNLQHQAELQFPHHIESRVAFLGLEGVNGQKKPMPTEVRGMLFQPQVISAAE